MLQNALHHLKHFQQSDRGKFDLAKAKIVEANIECALAHYEAEKAEPDKP